MTKAVADELVMASDGALELHEGYSGRGMFGARTTAVVYSARCELLAAIAGAADAIARSTPGAIDSLAFAAAVKKLRFDDMGLDEIAY